MVMQVLSNKMRVLLSQRIHSKASLHFTDDVGRKYIRTTNNFIGNDNGFSLTKRYFVQ